MFSNAAMFIAGLLTVGWGVYAFFMRRALSGEKIFPSIRPKWLGIFCWIYLTLAFLGWFGFLQEMKPFALLAAAMTSLAAAKFIFIFTSYLNLRSILILLWNNGPALMVVLISAVTVGGLMIFTAKLAG